MRSKRVTGDTSHAGLVARPVDMTYDMTVLVTGASGTLGSAVLPRLIKQGFGVRPMSRRARPGWVVADVATGVGLREAVSGVDAIVHLASAPGKAQRTDVEGTRRLLDEAKAEGVRLVLYVSINGIDRVPNGYYRAKLATEEVVKASGIPFTILRAAQFHSFVEMLLTVSGKLGPLIIDPKFLVQPVSIEDVADRIAELLARARQEQTDAAEHALGGSRPVADNSGRSAAGGVAGSAAGSVAGRAVENAMRSVPRGPAGDEPIVGMTIEYAGPQVLSFDELARTLRTARRSRRPIWRIRIPGKIARALRAGAQTSKAMPTGTRTWADYLAGKY